LKSADWLAKTPKLFWSLHQNQVIEGKNKANSVFAPLRNIRFS
jgi:hypothetical protein